MTHPRSPEQRIEEMSEEIWSLAERGERSRTQLIKGSKLGEESAREVLQAMLGKELIQDLEGEVSLLPAGEALARLVVRRHRLAEMLLGQVLAVNEEETDITACQVEHILSAEVTDRICTYLGHPPTCPHGKRIPRGDCCAAFRQDAQPLVRPLSDLAIGGRGRVVFITPALNRRLERLMTLGLHPGGVVRLQQNRPSVVLEVGETSVALDREICREIYVLPLLDSS